MGSGNEASGGEELPAREYRLIPVDKSKEESESDNAVDMVALIHNLRDRRWLIAKITGGFLILGLLIALFSTAEYTSDALVLPDTGNAQGSSNLLQSYTDMLGLGDLGSMNLSEEGGIPPMVYPKIVQSLTFQNNLLEHEYYFGELDTTITGYTYFREFYGPSLGSLFVEYTIGFPGKIWGSDATATETLQWAKKKFNADSIVALSPEQLEIIEEMRERVHIELDSQTGVLTITAKMPDAVAAAQVNRTLINMLKEFIKSYSTQKAAQNLDFAQLQYDQAKERYEMAQSELTEFQEENINPSSARAQARERELETEFDIASTMYNNVSQQLMSARMKVQEQTPVFKSLQEANVPAEKSEPNRIFILLLSIFIGLVVSFLYVAGKQISSSVRSSGSN